MLIATNGMCYVEELVKTHSDGGLHLPQGAKGKSRILDLHSGIVYALDKNDEHADGIDIGDTVVYPSICPQIPVRLDGKDLIVVGTSYIAGIVAKASDKTDDPSTAENSNPGIPESICHTNVSGENN